MKRLIWDRGTSGEEKRVIEKEAGVTPSSIIKKEKSATPREVERETDTMSSRKEGTKHCANTSEKS